jgi:hypothetical protein
MRQRGSIRANCRVRTEKFWFILSLSLELVLLDNDHGWFVDSLTLPEITQVL